MCGSVAAGVSLDGVDLTRQSVIQGAVLRGNTPESGAYVRLLDQNGEFTAEVPTSATGQFRFFAAPGNWTLRTLAPRSSPVDQAVVAARGAVCEVIVALS